MCNEAIHRTAGDGLAIRSITSEHLEDLRNWKNAHRQYFFHQAIIEMPDQARWFAGYLQRAEDFMFVVECEGKSIGCMGIRWAEPGWDVYNVILGRTEFAGRGRMGRAFQTMMGFAMSRRAALITLKVLKDNPAIGWYIKNGFCVVADGGDHLAMQHQQPA